MELLVSHTHCHGELLQEIGRRGRRHSEHIDVRGSPAQGGMGLCHFALLDSLRRVLRRVGSSTLGAGGAQFEATAQVSVSRFVPSRRRATASVSSSDLPSKGGSSPSGGPFARSQVGALRPSTAAKTSSALGELGGREFIRWGANDLPSPSRRPGPAESQVEVDPDNTCQQDYDAE